ncbi:MAG: NADH-quinone oxidoreductase subunit NuoN [Betaproteobacteria bacterium]
MFENFVIPDLLPALPEIFIAIMALVILMLDLVLRKGKRQVVFALTQLTLFGALVIQMFTSTGEPVFTFSNLFIDDLMSDFLKAILYITVMVTLLYSRGYVGEREAMDKSEFYVLALFATLGMMVMISANHFLTIYLGLELLSLALYAMVAMNRESVVSTEAAMKYFILGALASGILLYGMSMLYGATGALEITGIAERLRVAGSVNPNLLAFGLVFIVAGLAFKLGVVPFHMWIPDVYHGAPTGVTLFIASAPKLAAFAVVMRLLVNGLLTQAQDWQTMLLIMSVLSMAIGNLAAVAQTNIKRMLAYSAISHMGFMLLGIVTGVVGDSAIFASPADMALSAYSSAMFYVISYVMMTAGAFGVILLLARAGFEADELEDFKGLNKRSPWFAGMMLIMMFSLAGIPFFVGFLAKLAVLQAVIASGLYWLAIVAVVFSVIGAFYYLRVVKLMYFDAPADTTPIKAPLGMRIVLSANGLAVALFGIFPHWLTIACVVALGHSLYL